MYVKICGLSEEQHVEAAVEGGADAIGFVMTASPRWVSPARAAELAALVPPHVLTVGVFKGETPEEVRQATLESGMRGIQLHGAYPAEAFAALRDLAGTLVRAGGSDADLRSGALGEDLLIIDAPRPGSGEAWDWSAVRDRASGSWLLAGGLTPGNVRDAIAAARPWGVDVSSGVETAPGKKDSTLIHTFLRNARS